MSRDGNVKIAVVGLNPGPLRTARVLMYMTTAAAERRVLQKTGQLLWVCDLAKEYGFTGIDGRLISRVDPKAPRQEYP
jgi:hypothetical protein